MIRRIILIVITLGLSAGAIRSQTSPRTTLQYFGQSCFLLTTLGGARIVMDPHHKLDYPLPKVEADAVTVSHEHFDHNNVESIKGNPVVIRGLKNDGTWNDINQTVKGVHIYSVGVYHDNEQGAKRGRNSVFVFEFDNIRLAQMGDLGHTLDDNTIKKIGKIDFILIPVGGYFTINSEDAWRVVNQLNPRVVIPMHYRTAKTRDLPIQPVDGFLKGKKDVKQLVSTVTDLVLPARQEVWVFQTP